MWSILYIINFFNMFKITVELSFVLSLLIIVAVPYKYKLIKYLIALY